MDPSIDYFQVLGRLHPVMVHFPIALLMLAGFLELFRRKERPTDATMVCLVFGSLAAILAAWAGWEFAEHDGPGPSRTMWLHRWGGIVVAGLSVLCVLFGYQARRGTRPKAGVLFRGGILVCAVLVGFVAHQGGTSVWGEGFVFELLEGEGPGEEAIEEPTESPIMAKETEIGEPAGDEPSTGDSIPATRIVPTELLGPTGVDYATQIQPILAASCYKCHGPKRRPKAGLRLSDMSDVFAGAQEDWVIQPGQASASLLVQRVTLPSDHEDFMPSEGEPLTAEQVSLIRDWIDQGAEWTEVSLEAEESEAPEADAEAEEVGQAVESTATPALALPVPLELDARQREVRDAAIEVLRERGAFANRIAQNTDEVEVNLGLLSEQANDDSLELLAGLEPCLVSLDLSRSAVTSAGLERLAAFPRLRRLRLDQTSVDDAGLQHVAALGALEYLNLVSTPVTDAGLARLDGLSGLKKLYLWQTEVTDAGVADLSDALPELVIVRDTYTPPVIETEADPAPVASAACCDAAEAAGRECDHPCCVEAAAEGEVCPKCSA